jgi:hypothetical protein
MQVKRTFSKQKCISKTNYGYLFIHQGSYVIQYQMNNQGSMLKNQKELLSRE